MNLQSRKQFKRSVSKRSSGIKPVTRGPVKDMKAVTTASFLACDTTGAIALLNGIAPGYAVDQRLGRVVILDQVEASIEARVTATTGIDQYQRWMLVMDKQPNGAALVITDVLDSASPISALNLANRGRFKILADRFFQLNASAEPGSKKTFNVSIPLNERVTYNSGTAGTVADIATNSMYLITCGNIAAGATAGSNNSVVRVFFHNLV